MLAELMRIDVEGDGGDDAQCGGDECVPDEGEGDSDDDKDALRG